MPQKVKGNESLAKFTNSIGEIEKRTDLDFLSNMNLWIPAFAGMTSKK